MKKLRLKLITMVIIFMTALFIGCDDGDSNNTLPPTPKPTDDVLFVPNDNGTVKLHWKVWGLSNEANGDITFQDIQSGAMDDITMYLHTKSWNNEDSCDDVVAEGYIDRDGWLIFKFYNPKTVDGFLERFWASDTEECGPNDPSVSWAYVPKERNPFRRNDCNGKPGIEVIFWEDGYDTITVVPPDTPCDEVGAGCTPPL